MVRATSGYLFHLPAVSHCHFRAFVCGSVEYVRLRPYSSSLI